MKYMKAIPMGSQMQSLLLSGALVLQSGQFIDIHGDGNLSVFDFVDTKIGYIRAYHGADTAHALRKYRYAKKLEKEYRENEERRA